MPGKEEVIAESEDKAQPEAAQKTDEGKETQVVYDPKVHLPIPKEQAEEFEKFLTKSGEWEIGKQRNIEQSKAAKEQARQEREAAGLTLLTAQQQADKILADAKAKASAVQADIDAKAQIAHYQKLVNKGRMSAEEAELAIKEDGLYELAEEQRYRKVVREELQGLLPELKGAAGKPKEADPGITAIQVRIQRAVDTVKAAIPAMKPRIMEAHFESAYMEDPANFVPEKVADELIKLYNPAGTKLKPQDDAKDIPDAAQQETLRQQLLAEMSGQR